jgi:septal ring factor EnvC (AmiA/AmiB activator)
MSTYDDDAPAPHDRFLDVLRLLDAAANAKTVAAGVKKLRKLESDIAAAGETLARLQKQASGLLETARAEAERIVKDAEQQVAEDKGEREHHEQQLVYFKRLLARLEGGAALRQAREAIAAEDDAAGRIATFQQFEEADDDYRRADPRTGLVDVPMSKGLTRTFVNKPRREATQ